MVLRPLGMTLSVRFATASAPYLNRIFGATWRRTRTGAARARTADSPWITVSAPSTHKARARSGTEVSPHVTHASATLDALGASAMLQHLTISKNPEHIGNIVVCGNGPQAD